MEGILDTYKEVLMEPRGLQPRRHVDHKIPLKKRVKAINVRIIDIPM